MNALTPINNTPAPIVFEKDGEVYANSRDVAKYFGKRHVDVIRSIRKFQPMSDWGVRNFAFTKNENPQNKVTYSSYDMTKKGFTRLVLSFTGDKARSFIEAYLDRFNDMEAILKANPLVTVTPLPALPQSFADALQLAADKQREVEALQTDVALLGNAVDKLGTIAGERLQLIEHQDKEITQKNKALYDGGMALLEAGQKLEVAQDDVNFVEKYVKSEGSKSFRDTAKLFNMGPKAFTQLLEAEGFIFKNKLVGKPVGPWLA